MSSGLIWRERLGRGGVVLVVAGLHLAIFAMLARSSDRGAVFSTAGDGGFVMAVGLVSASRVGIGSADAQKSQRLELDALNAQLTESDHQSAKTEPLTQGGSSLLEQMSTSLAMPKADATLRTQAPPSTAAQAPAGQDGGNPWAHASVMSSSYREGQILAKLRPCWSVVRAHLPLQIRLTLNAQGGAEVIVPISSIAARDPIMNAAARAIRACGPYPTSGLVAVYNLLLPAVG